MDSVARDPAVHKAGTRHCAGRYLTGVDPRSSLALLIHGHPRGLPAPLIWVWAVGTPLDDSLTVAPAA
jgi:hypothetical protein